MRVTTGPTVTGKVTVGGGTFEAQLQKNIDALGYRYAVGAISPTVAGNILNFRLRNPTGSGKTVIVTQVSITANVNTSIDLDAPEVDSTINLAAVGTIVPRRRGQAAGVAVGSHQANTPGSGVAEPESYGLLANATLTLNVGVVLPANSQFDWDANNTAITTVYAFVVVWYEE